VKSRTFGLVKNKSLLFRPRPKAVLFTCLFLLFSTFSNLSSSEFAHADSCVPTTSTTSGLTTATFTSTGNCTWTIPDGVSFMDILLVGGGGSGGSYGGGGGGGGGIVYKTSYSVTAGSQVSLTVGAGGIAPTDGSSSGTNGSDSKFGTLTAVGGGGGGAGGDENNSAYDGSNGGSGGGGGVSRSPNAGNGGSNSFNVLTDQSKYGNPGGNGAFDIYYPYFLAGGGGGAGGGGACVGSAL